MVIWYKMIKSLEESLMQEKGFHLKHCRSNCPKLARDWNDLYDMLTKELKKLNLPEALEDKFQPVLHHHLPKISLVGCPNGCSHPNIRDFGISGYVTPIITTVVCSGCNLHSREYVTMKP